MGKGALLASVCALALIGASSASAQSPSTLDGETLVSLFSKCNESSGTGPPPSNPCTQNPAPPTVEATCDEAGDSTLAYDITASGPQNQGTTPVVPSAAAGPYNGSFTESGTVRIGEQDGAPVPNDPSTFFSAVLTGSNGFDTGPLLTWEAEFEIQAGTSRVVGTKTLTTRVPPNFGVCAVLENELAPNPPFGAPVPRTGYAGIADARLAYRATIITPNGHFRDEGTAESDLREVFVRCCGSDGLGSVSADVGFLVEVFDSTQATTTPLSKNDCKKGGWATLGMGFKNQGDCVSYFATNGKNGPAG